MESTAVDTHSAIESADSISFRDAEGSWQVDVGDVVCRMLDLMVAGILLVILAPLLVLVASAIKLDSKGPVLFRQRRLGHRMVPFTLQKFRTMTPSASPDIHREFVLSLIAGHEPPRVEGAPQFKLVRDSRVTRIGRFLRRSSLDELPQLWNVLRGDMSLVGPRPPIQYEVEHYPEHWFARFTVKPGLTGLWQISGRSELTMEQMISLDVEYARRRSPWLNIMILLRTIPVVLTARGAS